jgi:hypothetical protein
MKLTSPFLSILCLALLLSHVANTAAFQAKQKEPPLRLNQIERLLDLKFEDDLLAAEITQRGVAFKVDAKAIEQLQRRGLGAQARQALLQQEEQQAYAAFMAETADAARRLALGREFLRAYPRSEHLPRIQAELRGLELEAFKTRFQTFLIAPDALKLSQLLETGQALLKESDDSATVLPVTIYLATAAAKGALSNFFQDIARSQDLAKAAIRLLEEQPVADRLAALRQELREQYLGELYRAQALYLLRQINTEPELALNYLDKAIQVGQTNVAKEAMTYWLRTLARDGSYQKHAQALARPDLAAADRQTICAGLSEIREKLVEDYTRVVSLSADAKGRSLHDEANLALKKLLNKPHPCTQPTTNPAELAEAKNSPVTSRRARKVKPDEPKLRNVFINSKTLYLNPRLLEAALLKQPDFPNGAWRIVRNLKEADLVVEINLPFMTWNWTFEVTQPASSTLLATGKVREALASQAVPRLAEELNQVLKRLREQ